MKDLNIEIKRELEEMGSKLTNLPKLEPNLSVPIGYFEQLETQLMDQYIISSSINMEAPKVVPNGYFDLLEDKLVERIQGTNKPSNIIRLQKFWKWAAAASVILIIGSLMFFQQPNVVNDPAFTNELVSQDEYIQYLEDNIDEFDINMLIENDLIDDIVISDLPPLGASTNGQSEEALLDFEVSF